jgi:hypothetical protein
MGAVNRSEFSGFARYKFMSIHTYQYRFRSKNSYVNDGNTTLLDQKEGMMQNHPKIIQHFSIMINNKKGLIWKQHQGMIIPDGH